MCISQAGIIKLNGDVVQLSCSGTIAAYETRMVEHQKLRAKPVTATEYAKRLKKKAGLDRPRLLSRKAIGRGARKKVITPIVPRETAATAADYKARFGMIATTARTPSEQSPSPSSN